MLSPLTAVCRDCQAVLPEVTLDAADLIYGTVGSGFHDRLLDALERSVERADTDPVLRTDPERDEHAAESAVLEALGLSSFADLTAAFRHYGRYGECRP